MSPLDGLPDWSRTNDPSYHIHYTALLSAVVGFVKLGEPERRAAVEKYSGSYCNPKFILSKASGFYLFLRFAFQLPREYPRESVKVFGGWDHPSVGDVDQPFLISWPVQIDQRTQHVTVAPFQGYMGIGYDAVGEYDYFLQHFPLRSVQALHALRLPD